MTVVSECAASNGCDPAAAVTTQRGRPPPTAIISADAADRITTFSRGAEDGFGWAAPFHGESVGH